MLYFEIIDFGNKLLYVVNVIFYESKDDKKFEFIFDMDLCYNGDVIIKLVVKKVKLGLLNIELWGMFRVIFKFLVVEYNFIGGIIVFFLNRFKLKFDLINLLNVLDFFGFKSSLCWIIDDVIVLFVVLFNCIVILFVIGVEVSDF